MSNRDYHASVVIPAYNEERVVARCLASLKSRDPMYVVVSANGCRDNTAQVVRALGANVVESEIASKAAALNRGDNECGEIYPRVYLDADISLSSGALDALVRVLSTRSSPAVAMPQLRFNTDGCSRIVRAFYRTYSRLPYITEGLVGSGCYAVNSSGRQRWKEFPDVIADDLFVQGTFAASERLVLDDVYCLSYAPRNVRALLQVRTRTYQGNRQLERSGEMGVMKGSSYRTVKRLFATAIKDPLSLPDYTVYLAITIIARIRSRRYSDDGPWLKDESTR